MTLLSRRDVFGLGVGALSIARFGAAKAAVDANAEAHGMQAHGMSVFGASGLT
jgi:hypothetical protein